MADVLEFFDKMNKWIEDTTGINLSKNRFENPQMTIPGTNGKPHNPFTEEEIKETPSLQDKTEENIEQTIGGVGQSDVFKYMEEMQQRQWEREDLIRKETQEREDTAYQRMVEDMKAAGINPNIFQGTPSASGGGITNATGINYSALDNEVKEKLTLLQQEIDNEFKGNENAKDRITNVIGDVIQAIIFKALLGG